MKALDRKFLRDLWRLKTQALAIALVIGCGVATFVMSLNTLAALKLSRDQYYARYRFAHVFAQVKRAPNSLAERIAEIPGVAAVQTRVVADVTLDIPGMMEQAVGRLISLPRRPSEVTLNGLHLRRGRFPEPGRRGEALANEAFAEAHGFRIGDKLKALINGKLESLTIVGIALSPEYIYQIRPGEIFPDNKRFGVLWMGYDELSAAHDLRSAFNNIALSLTRGASQPEVLKRLDELTARYGGLGAYGREDQISHKLVSDELTQLRAMAMIPPTMFLAVAAFLLNVVLDRLISTQREQIAALKAFGYNCWEVGSHYMKLALAIVVVGLLLGSVAGARFGHGMAKMYAKFFHFPTLHYRMDVGVLALAMVVSAAAALLGVLGAIRRAMRLPPAEAMRPEPPVKFRPTLIERMGLRGLFSQPARMVLRQLERRPGRASLSVLGIAMGIAVMVLGSFSKDILDHVIDHQFRQTQRYDYNVGFIEPASSEAGHSLERLPGVLRSEPYRAVAARVRFGHRSRRLSVLGLPENGQLFRLKDMDQRDVPLPEHGLVVSEKLGELLGARVGDWLTLEVLEGERPVRRARIASFLKDFSGTAIYARIGAINHLLQEGPRVSGAFLDCDAAQAPRFHASLKETPRMGAVASKRAALLGFQETISENLLRMRIFNVVFASIIAFGVVYNCARITLSERGRDLATLRVIGLTRREISGILLGEIAALTLAAIPVGLAMGYGLSALTTAALETESQRFPLVVRPATYGWAVLVTLIAATVSSLIVRRRLDRLDLVAVLKASD